MRRIWLGPSAAAVVVFLAGVVAAVAQPAARIARIGYLTAAGLQTMNRALERLFAVERHVVLRPGLPFGSSVLAVARR